MRIENLNGNPSLANKSKDNQKFIELLNKLKDNQKFIESINELKGDQKFIESLNELKGDQKFIESLNELKNDQKFIESLNELKGDQKFIESLNELKGDQKFIESLNELKGDQKFIESLNELKNDQKFIESLNELKNELSTKQPSKIAQSQRFFHSPSHIEHKKILDESKDIPILSSKEHLENELKNKQIFIISTQITARVARGQKIDDIVTNLSKEQTIDLLKNYLENKENLKKVFSTKETEYITNKLHSKLEELAKSKFYENHKSALRPC